MLPYLWLAGRDGSNLNHAVVIGINALGTGMFHSRSSSLLGIIGIGCAGSHSLPVLGNVKLKCFVSITQVALKPIGTNSTIILNSSKYGTLISVTDGVNADV